MDKNKQKQKEIKQTKMFRLFWPPHEGIISKSENHRNINKKRDRQNTNFQTSLAEVRPPAY